MCVQAHCISNWFFPIDPVKAWQWIGPHGSGRSGVEIINTVIYPSNTGCLDTTDRRNHPQFDQVHQQVLRTLG
jgi:ABC-type branched-subunit amino acid transport system ATPase component